MVMGVSSRRKVVVLMAVRDIRPVHVIVGMPPFDHHRSVVGSRTVTPGKRSGGTEQKPFFHEAWFHFGSLSLPQPGRR